MDPKDQHQAVRFGGRYYYTLSHLPSPYKYGGGQEDPERGASAADTEVTVTLWVAVLRVGMEKKKELAPRVFRCLGRVKRRLSSQQLGNFKPTIPRDSGAVGILTLDKKKTYLNEFQDVACPTCGPGSPCSQGQL